MLTVWDKYVKGAGGVGEPFGVKTLENPLCMSPLTRRNERVWLGHGL